MADNEWSVTVKRREGSRDKHVQVKQTTADRAGLPTGVIRHGFIATDYGYVYVISQHREGRNSTAVGMIWEGDYYQQTNNNWYKDQGLITVAMNFAKKVAEGKLDERVEAVPGGKKEQAPGVEKKKP